MRMMFRARLDTPAANEAFRKGRLPKIMEEAAERLQPEAAYFCPTEGGRSCIFVFDMQDSSQMPVIAESFFQELGAEVEFTPVMNREDLRKGLQELEQQR